MVGRARSRGWWFGLMATPSRTALDGFDDAAVMGVVDGGPGAGHNPGRGFDWEQGCLAVGRREAIPQGVEGAAEGGVFPASGCRVQPEGAMNRAPTFAAAVTSRILAPVKLL